MDSAMHTKWGAHRNTRALMLGAYSLTAMLILGLLVAVAGCVREASDGSETPQRMASLEAEVTIGAAEGPEEYLFNSIQCVLVAQDGTVWVLDGRVPVLRQFDSGGYYLRHVGRQGGGPGGRDSVWEFKDFPKDGPVCVWDADNENKLNTINNNPDSDNININANWNVVITFHTSIDFYTSTLPCFATLSRGSII